MYQTESLLRRELRVRYPAAAGRIVLRTELDWVAKFYLDSGWPGDNYEVTLAMAMALSSRGYRVREDFLHLPLQLGLGRTSTASRQGSV